MPIYEYQCKSCSHIFEREHGIGEKKKFRCPDCSSQNTKKIISQVGVVFKGSGFYKTDNRKSGNGGGSSGLKSTGKETEKESSDTKTDTDSTTCKVSEN